jgi:hypothetical protein
MHDYVKMFGPLIRIICNDEKPLTSKDGNGAVWVRFRPAPPRPDPFRYPPQKTRLLPRPACLTGTRLTRPDGYPTRPDLFFKGFFQSVSSDPVNVELNQPLDRIWPNHHHRSSESNVLPLSWIQTRSEPPSICAYRSSSWVLLRSVLQTRSVHASAANPRRERCYAVDG